MSAVVPRIPGPLTPLAALVSTFLLLACAQPPGSNGPASAVATAPAASAPVAAAAPAVAAAPVAPPPILPFNEAVMSAANTLLSKAQLADPNTRHPLVIDPLIDGMTGWQSAATAAMGYRIGQLVKEKYSSQYQLQAFKADTLARSPLVLIGTFTGVNKERKTEGRREAYRICLALADLKTGKLVSKGLAFAASDGVDPTPTAPFRDAPVWAEDPSTLGYIRTCQGTRPGDAIHPAYVDRILTASAISEAQDAYAAGRYRDALGLFENALQMPAGKQLRTYSGLYLSNWRLGRRDAAGKAFGELVNLGLDNKRLGVKFLFRPGSTAFLATPPTPGQGGTLPYPVWLTEIAGQAGKRSNACLEVVGHSSATGPEPLNERLSLLRAEGIKRQLEADAPGLSKRLIAHGMGSRETLVGNGRDDLSDALDRRVEFKVVSC